MKYLTRGFVVLMLGLGVSVSAIAAPKHLVIVNNTDYESNAYLNGKPSPFPTKAHTTGKVSWVSVKMACKMAGYKDICLAEIKMKTRVNPTTVGTLQLTLEDGVITPNNVIANGFEIKVDGAGAATISEIKS